MLKYKIGDRLRMMRDGEITNHFKEGEIVKVTGTDTSGIPYQLENEDGDNGWAAESVLAPVSRRGRPAKVAPILPMKFILQYELDEDPFELFATMQEVKRRIAVLANDATLKRESIRVYEIKKTLTVKLSTAITIK